MEGHSLGYCTHSGVTVMGIYLVGLIHNVIKLTVRKTTENSKSTPLIDTLPDEIYICEFFKRPSERHWLMLV